MDQKKRFAQRARQYFGDGIFSEMVVLYGDHRAIVRGCRKILSYEPQEICFSLRGRNVRLCGKALYCISFTRGTVSVEGTLTAVEFYGGKEE